MSYPRPDHIALLDTPEKRRRYLLEWQRTCDDIMARAGEIVVQAANVNAPWPLVSDGDDGA